MDWLASTLDPQSINLSVNQSEFFYSCPTVTRELKSTMKMASIVTQTMTHCFFLCIGWQSTKCIVIKSVFGLLNFLYYDSCGHCLLWIHLPWSSWFSDTPRRQVRHCASHPELRTDKWPSISHEPQSKSRRAVYSMCELYPSFSKSNNNSSSWLSSAIDCGKPFVSYVNHFVAHHPHFYPLWIEV